MGKVIFWIVVVFVVLFVLRLVNAASGKRRRDEAASRVGRYARRHDGAVPATAACSCRRPRRRPLPVASSAPMRRCAPAPLTALTGRPSTAINEPMQPSPAIPPFEPPLPVSAGDSARRILWIIGLYRAICGASLLGIALLLDLQPLAVSSPNAFVTAAGTLFPVRPPRVLVDPARPVADAAARASRRRCWPATWFSSR